MPGTRKVGILGGMGPAAGADFLRLFVGACEARLRASGSPVSDQAFPEHWLAQLPVPDRTLALLEDGPSPVEGMTSGIEGLRSHGVASIAIACNTAHAWHAKLQRSHPDVELLHIVEETAKYLAAQGAGEVALMATEGTYRIGLYEQALAEAGLGCHVPSEDERRTIARGIFEGVKAGDMALAERCFSEVALRLAERHGPVTIIMGCTEVPLGLAGSPAVAGLRLVDPAQVLAAALARRAYEPR
jgi:aspartate racemase